MHAPRVGIWIVTTTLVGCAGSVRPDLAAHAPGPAATDAGRRPAAPPAPVAPSPVAPTAAIPVAPSPPTTDEIPVGCSVIAAPDGPWLGFFFGTVASLEGSRVVVERVVPGGRKFSTAVDRSRVWRRDAPPLPPAGLGEAMICPRGTFWMDMPSGCVVARVEGDRTYCQDNLGGPFQCEANGLVRPDPATQAAIKANVERQARFRTFRAAAIAAGMAVRPEGWKPMPRAKILIHNEANGDWFLGVVKEVRTDGIVVSGTVKWDITIDKNDMFVPVPTRARTAEVGQYVLAQWSPDHWVFGRVAGIKGDLFEVADGYDERKLLGGIDIIPIERP